MNRPSGPREAELEDPDPPQLPSRLTRLKLRTIRGERLKDMRWLNERGRPQKPANFVPPHCATNDPQWCEKPHSPERARIQPGRFSLNPYFKAGYKKCPGRDRPGHSKCSQKATASRLPGEGHLDVIDQTTRTGEIYARAIGIDIEQHLVANEAIAFELAQITYPGVHSGEGSAWLVAA
jgi:hypothetical protein